VALNILLDLFVVRSVLSCLDLCFGFVKRIHTVKCDASKFDRLLF